MLISLHKQATTTPKVRAAIQASDEPAWKVAERYGISGQTVWKWRNRDSTEDRSHTPHRLQTTLTPAQEAVAVALRRTLLLPLDDLLAVVREFLNPNVSRSGLDRCLRRHGAGNLRDLKPKEPKPAHKPFKAYEPGYLHIDVKYLPQMADEERRRYLFVAIDRATRWVFVRIYPAKTAANARRFLRDLDRAAPMKITRVLTERAKSGKDDGDGKDFGCSASAPPRHRQPRVRPPLRRTRHRAPPRAARAAAHERHGRAVQRPDRGRPAKPPIPLRRGPRTDDPALRPPLQRPAPAIRPEKPNAHRRPERMAQTEAGTLQETALQSHRM
jgi:transposase-like protein